VTATMNEVPAGPRPEWPLVSVVIPTRGRPELVRETIAAVIAQTYPGEIESVIVHDQEAPDEDLVNLSVPGRPVRVVANTHTPGLAGARNSGLDHATGAFIASCDDDDLFHPDKVEKQVSRMLAEPDLLAVGSGMRLRMPGNRIVDWPGRAELIPYDMLLRSRVKELHSSTMLIRREAFEQVGTYDEGVPYGHGEDWDWLLRAARVGRIGTVTEPLAVIRKDVITSRERWHSGGAQNIVAGLTYMLAKHPDLASTRKGYARILGKIAYAQSQQGNRGEALRYEVRSLTRWPITPDAYLAIAHTVTGIHPRHFLRAARRFGRGV